MASSGVHTFGPFNIARPFLLLRRVTVPVFAQANGSIGAHTALKNALKYKSPGKCLLATLRNDALYTTCSRLQKPVTWWSTTWAVANVTNGGDGLDLLNIDLDKEARNEQDEVLEATLVLRATPTIQALRDFLNNANLESNVAALLNKSKLALTLPLSNPAAVDAILGEFQEAGWFDGLPTILPKYKYKIITHSVFADNHKPVELALRRGKRYLQLDDLESLKPRNDQRAVETMLCYKVIENPDFPLMARVRPGHAAFNDDYVRDDFFVPASIAGDIEFFAQPIFTKKLKTEVAKNGKLPPPPMIGFLKRSALRELNVEFEKELADAEANEHERLISSKIEPFLDEVAVTDEERKKVRKIKLQDLVDAGINECSCHDKESIKALLRLELDKTLAHGAAADVDERLISDVVSIYSEDLFEDQWIQKWHVDDFLSKSCRTKILDWIVDGSPTMHNGMSHGGIFHAQSETEDDLLSEFKEKAYLDDLGEWVKLDDGETMLAWPNKLGEVGEEEEDGNLPERDAGFYTDMLSSLSSASEEDADSDNASEDEDNGSGISSPDASENDELEPKLEVYERKNNRQSSSRQILVLGSSLFGEPAKPKQELHQIGPMSYAPAFYERLDGNGYLQYGRKEAASAIADQKIRSSIVPLNRKQGVECGINQLQHRGHDAGRDQIRAELKTREDEYVARKMAEYRCRNQKPARGISTGYDDQQCEREVGSFNPDALGYRQACVNGHGQLA